MPKKAVAIFFLCAFLGAVLFVYFTFPRTKAEIPVSNNQRPFPSAPSPTPDSVPVPETVPHPAAPKVPPGPTLHVMAWASGAEVFALEAEADAFGAATGRHASLTIDADAATYEHDLQAALLSDTPPDVCLVAARNFSGTDPSRDLADIAPATDAAPRSVAAFTLDGRIKAVPTEFSVDVLYYNPAQFDEAGLGYPGPHWTWDTLEAMSRALASLKLKTQTGQTIYPLELPANFDFWNLLCAQAGGPALDLDTWHLSDSESRDSQMRALDFIHEYFQDLSVTAPLPKNGQPPGHLFAEQRASLLIASSELTASLPKFRYELTLLPSDLARASLARVNGWAVTSHSMQPAAALALATYLAHQPVHAGWRSVQKPADGDARGAVCYQALAQAVLPRLDAKTTALAQFLDQQIDLMARGPNQKTADLYARIQAEYLSDTSAPAIGNGIPRPAGTKPAPKATGAILLRDF